MGDRQTALQHAWSDGEDFELLFTVSARRAAALEKAWAGTFPLRLTRLGHITQRRAQVGMPAAQGYEHFR
jgi:thiamine-monophosphate kinase